MEPAKESEKATQYVRISKPSRDDVEYLKALYKKGIVEAEDLRSNMSFVDPYHGEETHE